MSQQVVVNHTTCIGCGMCVSVAPGVFEMGDEGMAVVVAGKEEACEEAMEAIGMCPAKAIGCQEG